MSPAAASVLFAVGIGMFVLSVVPGVLASPFSNEDPRRSLGERLRIQLRLAGVFDQTPNLVLMGLIAASTIAALVFGILAGSVWAAIPAPLVVFAGAHMYLLGRQRQFLNRATDELIPFLNRIATAVQAGKPAQTAYLDAVGEADLLRDVLGDSAAKISAGKRFAPALVETLDILPLRMWSVFVRQLELHDEMGGDVTLAIETTISQVNQMLQLQAEARADYANQARQQKLIVGIVAGGIAAFIVFVPNGIESMKVLVTTGGGLIGLAIGLAIGYFGLWFGKKQLRDIEKKLAF